MRLLCVECSRHVPVFATHCPYCYPSTTPRVSEPPTTEKSDESRAGSGSSIMDKIRELMVTHTGQMAVLFVETQKAARLEALEWAMHKGPFTINDEVQRLKGEK